MHLILASTSPTRAALLDRLGLNYHIMTATILESTAPHESSAQTALRLSYQKAAAIAVKHPNAWVIGSDQICCCEGKVFGKPLTIEVAKQQLAFFSGKNVEFFTGISLVNAHSHQAFNDVIPYHVEFKHLSHEKIERYLKRDQPLDCAGSFKYEQLGIALFNKMQGEDPTALQGLPLIRLCDFLELANIPVL